MSDVDRTIELTNKLIDGSLDDAEAAELDRLVADGGEAAETFDSLLETEATLRGLKSEIDLAERTVARIKEVLGTRVEGRVMGAIRGEAREPDGGATKYASIDPHLPWLASRRFWRIVGASAAALLLAFGIHANYMLSRHAQPQEAFLYGQAAITPGHSSAYRAFVRNAASNSPISGAEVRFALYDPSGDVVWEARTASNDLGIAEAVPDVALDADEGEYKLELDVTSADGQSTISRNLNVKRSFKVLVTTDKPLYQPGQTIHIRTLSLSTADLRPIAGRDALIEVRDAKGNKVFKKSIATSSFGVTSADFVLADQVNTGEYAISATVGDTLSERSVEVKRYALPKYKVELVADRGYYQPGQTVKLDILAQYTFGKPVRNASVAVVASEFLDTLKPFAQAMGTTDADGRASLDIELKDFFAGTQMKKGDAFVSIAATVQDTTGHVQKRTLDLTVASEPIRIEVFPESGEVVQGVENIIYIVTAYPDGRPAKTTLTIGKTNQRVETSAMGIAKVKMTPVSSHLKLTVQAEDAFGAKGTAERALRMDSRSNTLLLRTNRAVFKGGETAVITVLSPGHTGRVFLDAVRDRRTLFTKGLDLVDGSARLDLDLEADAFGTIELHAYRIMRNGDIIGDAKVIQVARADDLRIEATLDKETYRPAEKAVLDLLVRRAGGEATQAALGLAGVDEAVFALHEARPGLERVYFMLQEEILKPRFEVHARVPLAARTLVDEGPPAEPEREEAAVVLFTSAEGAAVPATSQSELYRDRNERLDTENQEYVAGLWGLAASVPPTLHITLILLFSAYAISRLFRREPIAGASLSDRTAYARAARWVGIWWTVACYLPFVTGFLGFLLIERILGWYRSDWIVLILVGIAVAAGLSGLSIWAWRFRSSALSRATPMLRALVCALPFAYILGVASLPAVVGAVNMWPRGMEDGTAALLMLSVLVGSIMVVGFISSATSSALSSVHIGRWFKLSLSRMALAGAPLLAITFLLVPLLLIAGGAAGSKRAFSEAMEAGDLPDILSMNPRKTPPDSPEAAPDDTLTAPTRIRRHFPETLLWIPELITDENGKGRVEIPLADSITTWRLTMSAVSRQGELGAATKGLRVFQDFFVDIDFPATLTQHDRVTVPIAVYNYLKTPQDIRLEVAPASWFRLDGPAVHSLRVGADEVTAVRLVLEALEPGRHTLLVKAHGSQMGDALERSVLVEPDGRAVVQTFNGELAGDVAASLSIPPSAIEGATDLIVKIYPGAFSQVLEGLDGIFRMPSGCFEQTSSTTYPNVLVLDYMRRTEQIKPDVEMKALNFVNLGYQRLLTFEVNGGGFEWFGHDPAHLVLTAYGLMEFNDMAKVYDVDPDVIGRTREWILSKQQDDGSWKPDQGYTHAGATEKYVGEALRTTAYVTWALAESGTIDSGVSSGLDYVWSNIESYNDAYTLAVAANALAAGGRREDANALIKRLDAMKVVEERTVHWAPASDSEGATYSRGDALAMETTAIAAYAYLRTGFSSATANKALAWLVTKKDSFGTWQSTQATVHAMRALLTGTGPGGGTLEGDLQIAVNANGKLARELTITPETSDVHHLVSLRELVRAGENDVALQVKGEGTLAYQIVATHYVPWQMLDDAQLEKEISIDVAYDTTRLATNEMMTSTVTVKYNRPGAAMMTIVDLGIPPGFEVMTEAFEDMKSRGVLERWSMTGRQIILYLRRLEGGVPFAFEYQLRAKFPVKVKTPRSRVYQYYEPELNDSAPPVEIVVM